MSEKLSKPEIEQKVKEIFSKKSRPKEIKKAKKLAMSKNIKIGNLRKKFCKKCYSQDLKIKKITKNMKTIECRGCKHLSRYKIK